MLEHFKCKTAAEASDATSQEMAAVGRIVLGNRFFIVVPAEDVSRSVEAAASGRFDVDGHSLVVLQVTDQAAETVEQLTGRLTGRELEIAVLVAQGHATKVIAYRLGISEWTVATYLRRVFAKLGVESRAAMVYRCASLINATLSPVASARSRERNRPG